MLNESMGPVIERLSAVCREHPLREKVLVAPSLAIGHQVADAIAREGTQWINCSTCLRASYSTGLRTAELAGARGTNRGAKIQAGPSCPERSPPASHHDHQ